VGALLSLAALIAARDSRSRLKLSQALAGSLSERFAAGKVDKEKWNQLREGELRAGADPEEVPEYETAVRLFSLG
jgi:hypothetical protein